ncbi:UNVERIFIED_CONTAM: hypothetical protein Sradi_6400700 [Sesamum radiatum]|uniref:Uncharacterized protein n=1 Tax=Sesamum radiatum TaxID=300843 RepID=A0AAW2K3R3_SESRA
MPSPIFLARPSSYSRRSKLMILCSLIGLSGFIFGFVAIARRGFGYDCKYGKPYQCL